MIHDQILLLITSLEKDGLKHRHKNIAERYAEPICRGRAKLTEGCVRGWFSDAKKFFEEKNCEYMNDATRQYNGDETGFRLASPVPQSAGSVTDVVAAEVPHSTEVPQSAGQCYAK